MMILRIHRQKEECIVIPLTFLYKGVFCPFIQISVMCCPEAM